MSINSILLYSDEETLVPDKFDPDLETNRISILEKEVEELEKNLPLFTKHLSPSFFPSSFEDLDNKDRDREEYDGPPSLPPSLPTKESEKFLVDETAKNWEHGKLLNFYGRFKPKIEKPTSITADNYLDGIMSVCIRPEVSASPDDCLGILNGVIDREDVQEGNKESSHIKTTEEAYRVAAVAFARGLTVGVLENRTDDAISEINQIKDFIGESAEKFDNSNQISFLLSLTNQLGQLQAYLSEAKDTSVATKLPESANSFLITHPSIK